MGRLKHADRPVRGPGRKSRKQGDPELPQQLQTIKTSDGTLSANQKRKLKKKFLKDASVAAAGDKKDASSKSPKAKGLKAKPAKTAIQNEEEEEDLDEKMDFDFGSDDDEHHGADGDNLFLEDDDFLSEGEEAADEDNVDLDDDDDDNDDDDDDAEAIEDVEAEESDSALEKEQTEDDDAEDAEEEDSGVDMGVAGGMHDLEALDERIRRLQTQLAAKKEKGAVGSAGPRRAELRARLITALCQRYSYNEFLMTKFAALYPKSLLDFVQANEVDRPVTIRANTLKTRRRDLASALITRGVNLDPLGAWTRVGLVVYESQVPLGATPEYLAGHYLLQGASSMLPVMALAPKPGERVLDMCAAPGGKTTYLGQLMRNSGLIVANDVNRDRVKAVVGNCHRMGVHNVVVCAQDGRGFQRTMRHFDRVLLDAPCSGTGVIAKDASVKTSKSAADVQQCSHLQKQLLLSALDCLKVGGRMVYSTCSVLVEENEDVVNYALRRRPGVKLEQLGLTFGEPGFAQFEGRRFHPTLVRSMRYTPHVNNMDGFFVAKLVKMSEDKPKLLKPVVLKPVEEEEEASLVEELDPVKLKEKHVAASRLGKKLTRKKEKHRSKVLAKLPT